MSNYILKPENKGIANIMSLTVKALKGFYESDRTSTAVERFMQTASQLPGNGFLGWQMAVDKNGEIRAFAFSSRDVEVTPEDFGWIFQPYADVDAGDTDIFEDLRMDSRKVYLLRHMPGISDEMQAFVGQYRAPECAAHFRNVIGAMKESGAVIRFIRGTGFDGQSMIQLSLAEEMTLRMRIMLSLAFPNTVAADIMAAGNTDFGLPAKCLMESMMKLMEASVCGFSAEEEENSVLRYPDDDLVNVDCFEDDDYEDSETDDSDSCPKPDGKPGDEKESDREPDSLAIEELDLSIRTYNCLKRAGINTVGELRKMSEADFRNVRNLGRKSTEEIREKLAAMERALSGEQTAPGSSDLLAGLIGLKDVKEQVRKIAAYARMKKDMEASGKASVPVALNMEFVGNPGTAKTTVARILAGIFKEIGILSGSRIVETGRADLVAGYIGQTAINVKSVFERARGKLLFIDEAYSLVSDSPRDFGYEAINTIVQEMENNRDDTVVVFAGYPDKMESFFSMNPGLRSRVPFRISFPDYSADEMAQIVRLEAEKRGFSICPQGLEKVVSLCEEAGRYSDTGNGRFCRNIVENAILSYALRVYGEGTEDAEKDFTLVDEDFVLPDNMQTMPETQEAKKSAPIGFRY